MLLLNVLLALAWTALTGNFAVGNFAFGYLLGLVALFFARGQFSSGPHYFRRTLAAIWFVIDVVWQLVLANLKVARTVLFTPTSELRPGIVAVPLDLRTEAEITTLANLITLTPGTLSLDVSDDRSVLYVHSIEVDDPATFRRGIKGGFERTVRGVFQ